jgi:hypothetical protein
MENVDALMETKPIAAIGASLQVLLAGGIAEGISLVQELLIRVDPRQHLLH